jgi:hypothetical protein
MRSSNRRTKKTFATRVMGQKEEKGGKEGHIKAEADHETH